MRNLFLFSLLFLSLLSPLTRAQSNLKTFSEDEVKFLEELGSLFVEADKKPGRDFMEEFSLYYTEGKFNSEQKKFIYATCNFMLKKRMKAFGEFKSFLSSMMSFTTSGQSPESYAAWKRTIEKLQTGKTMTGFSSFIAMSENLFASNTIFKSVTTQWVATNNQYKFDYDSLPKLVYDKTNLRCFTKGDSAIIYDTRGVYYPTSGQWIGSGGKVDWKRAGIDPNMSWAELKKYKIALKSSQYVADSVTYYNKAYFSEPLQGVLTDKVLADMNDDKASYPEFNSYNKRFVINNIYPEVDYDGGFLVKGAKVIGSGNSEEPARLKFKRNKKVFLVANSKSFVIRADKIVSDKASVTMYWENDSIYHPGLLLKFIYKDKELSLIRDNQGLARSPYYDSYHMLDMYYEAFYWKIDEPTIEMKMIQGSSESNASFESSNFFKDARYLRLQGMDDVNPLVRIRDFANKEKANEFSVDKLARGIGIPHDQLRPFLVGLTTQGFVMYNSEKDLVTVKDRLFDYIKYKGGKKDYDVMEFNSTQGRNATNAQLNLLNFDLKIFGVDRIFLSDSQSVNIIPKDQIVTVKKNRDFNFAGVVNAGRFQFFGKEFSFEYDKFKINLTNVDSLRIRIQSNERDKDGNIVMTWVKTVIENINGDLLIDNFNNKSGRVNYPQYPIFNSKKDSYAYWDKGSIFGGVYSRDKVFFHLNPFTIDSLDNFTNDALAFTGDFQSGGIFPDFAETLRLQEDNSLGFKTFTPVDGYPMYGNKGKYVAEIKLSNQGLRGDGTLEYVTSTTVSKDFIFFPDSTNTRCETFTNKNQGGSLQFPKAIADSAFVHWRPYRDYMITTNKPNHPFEMYDGLAKHRGYTTLEPTGLRGNGVVSFYKADLESKNIKFSERTFDADTSDIKIQSASANDIGIATVNFKSHIDFDTKVGEFKSNGGGAYVKFPVNQYLCYMDQFKWFMEKDNLELSSDTKSAQAKAGQQSAQSEDLDLTGAEFISIHPDQDSLRFLSPRARYDIRNSIIYCHEVRYINVADARIFPDSGNVTIQKKARIETLQNSGILANTVTKYHRLYNAKVDIYGKKSYAGDADYNYVDENGEEQKVHFTKVATDATNQTIGEGDIAETSGFKLSPNFDYKGTINLTASNQNLTFKGSFRIIHNCDLLARRWVDFSGDVNPKEVYIPLGDSTVDVSTKKRFTNGLLLANDSVHVYSAFVSPRRGTGDNDLISVGGFIYYDKSSSEYRISNKEKIKELTVPGNYISLNASGCQVYAEGAFKMYNNLGQIKLKSFGSANHNLVNDTLKFNLVMALDFFFENSAIKLISEKMDASTSLLPVPFSRPIYDRSLVEMLGKKEADKLIAQVNLYGAFKRIPDELEHTLFLSDVTMKWNQATKSFVSVGPIGVGIILKNQHNKYLKGKIEIVQKKSGDFLNIYLEDDNSNWWFFSYSTGTMAAISSDEKFNTIIKELKPEKRKMDKEKGDAPYQFILGTANKKSAFLRKFEN